MVYVLSNGFKGTETIEPQAIDPPTIEPPKIDPHQFTLGSIVVLEPKFIDN